MNDYTIEPDYDHHGNPDGFWVVEWGTYEPWSVLAGQPRKQLVEHFPTVADALKAYPQAVAQYPSGPVARVPDLPSHYAGLILVLVLTQHWFDEIAAGRKRVEYRERLVHWETRIWNRRKELKYVRFLRGYTATEAIYAITHIDEGPCPYDGWEGTYYRVHFSE